MGEENREPAMSEIREADLGQPVPRSRQLLVSLYWGQFGADADWPAFEIGTHESGDGLQVGFARIGSATFEITGILAFPATQAVTLYSAPFHGGLRFQAGAISLWGGGPRSPEDHGRLIVGGS